MKYVESKIISRTGKAIHKYNLISEDDNILVGMSGGKDSYALLKILRAFQKRAPINFKLTAIIIDSGFENFETTPIKNFCEKLEIPFICHKTNIIKIIEDKRKENTSFCSFCARLRRGSLYTFAEKNGYNKIALGHHADDLIETLLMNQFFSGSIKAMAPLHISDDKKNTVIRPLSLVFEKEILQYSKKQKFEIIKNNCPLAQTEENSKRKRVKKLLNDLEKETPNIRQNILHSLQNPVMSHLLHDPNTL